MSSFFSPAERFRQWAVRPVLDAILRWIYPEVCVLCRNEPARPSTGYVGTECRARMEPLRPPFCARCGLPPRGDVDSTHTCANCRDDPPEFESARAALVAHGVVLDILHRYKYQRQLWFEPLLQDHLLAQAIPELRTGSWRGLVPVPLHPVKFREREFNQAERLARPLAAALGIPLRTDLVRRRVPTSTQTRLSREERKRNVRDAFEAFPGMPRIAGDWIVFDDVLTTGSTAAAVASVLISQGAERVVVWSVARATLDGSPLPKA